MNVEQSEKLEELRNIGKELSKSWYDYWINYSNIDSWQFWVNMLFLLIPLIILWFKIDRKHAFFYGYYGYSVHILSSYIDAYSTLRGHWEYPYKAFPLFPVSLSLDTSLIPVTYMLVYQWTKHRKKNYYVTLIILSAIFAFIFKPILSYFDLFQLANGKTYFHLYFWYFSGGVVAKLLTNVFIYLEKNAKGTDSF